MGVDLILIPFRGDSESATSYTVLDLERNSNLWPEIRSIKSYPVPKRFMTLVGSPQVTVEIWERETNVESYGEPVRWVFSADLTALRKHQDFLPDRTNAAVWAYLEQLSPDTKVALFWY